MIHDCFTFYNEFEVLRKRLRYLYTHVDKFVLVESTVTHSGQPKELFFDTHKGMFAEYLDKIVHVVVKDNPVDDNPWSRENHQRDCITRGLAGAGADDIVMISDVDEIPHIAVLETYKGAPDVAAVNMYAFQYSFKYIQDHEPWVGTVLTTRKHVDTTSPQKFRDTRWSYPMFVSAGWHLSSFGDAKHVYNKIKTFAHCNDGIHPTQTEEDFDKIVENGLWTDGKSKMPLTPAEVYDAIPKELTH